MTGPCAYPALLRNDDGDRFIDDLEFDDGFFCFFDHGAAVVAELLFVAFDFLDQQALHELGLSSKSCRVERSPRSAVSSCVILMASSRAS